MEKQGLYPKYTIIKNSTGKEVEDAFVLKPGTDKHARAALRAYANSIRRENPDLARDLDAWLIGIGTEESIREERGEPDYNPEEGLVYFRGDAADRVQIYEYARCHHFCTVDTYEEAIELVDRRGWKMVDY